MMAEADFAFNEGHPYIMANSIYGGVEALCQGGLGPAEAGALYWKHFGFRLGDIRIKVHVWHGEADIKAPFATHGKVPAEKLPHVKAKFHAREGHISLICKYLETILQMLI